MVGLSSNHTEMLTLLQAVKTTNVMRRLLQQLGYPQIGPTDIAEDNQPLITEVTHSRITPGIRHLDVPIAFLQEQFQRHSFKPIYTNTTDQPADINTKPHGGGSLRKIILSLIGFQHFPPSTSEHYKQLQLDLYLITPQRISQRRKSKST